MLTTKELLILSNLRNNSRESLTRMSRRIAIPVSTIYDKIKTYEQSLITRNTCLIDFTQLGYNTRATIMVKTIREDKDRLKENLIKNKHVNCCYKITSGYDYLIECVFRELRDVELFIEALEKDFTFEQKQVYYILEDVRKEAFLSNPELLKLAGLP